MSLFEKLEQVVSDWKPHREYLREAITYTNGTHTEDDVLLMILSDKLKLWSGEKSAIVTEFVEYPRMKVLNCFLGGGDKDELIAMEREKIAPFAKENGCKRITGGGRFGWNRVLKEYSLGGTFMYKDI